jgi:hypothetical protein
MNSPLNLEDKEKMCLCVSAKETTTYAGFGLAWQKGLSKQMDSVDAVLTGTLNRFY